MGKHASHPVPDPGRSSNHSPVGLVPGEKFVNVENISIVYAEAIRTESLIPVEGFYGDPSQVSRAILEVQNEVGSPNNQLEFEERLIIRINPKPRSFPGSLSLSS